MINGLSWPHTERLSYTVGDTVRWRLINTSADPPMHLHGFYFRVDSRGDGTGDTTYARAAAAVVVTELMAQGQRIASSGSRNGDGNWAFHCHIPPLSSHVHPRAPPRPPRVPRYGSTHRPARRGH